MTYSHLPIRTAYTTVKRSKSKIPIAPDRDGCSRPMPSAITTPLTATRIAGWKANTAESLTEREKADDFFRNIPAHPGGAIPNLCLARQGASIAPVGR
ncbi:hypothetical protein THICB2_220017 [Thiomonas sp. CB2]|nr:hypothetical protein THICB2_220017 [Thiomonas sp. CB2]CQR44740.1 hypothetical protein THICB3560105 [Thiomonas sp. CB3]VDY05792.1 protein of unknown function [Thiomonas sp. Bio17B3]VDY10909.1 protein of unknown function [Thiomonas sp. Sup16B3]VDY14051.1 conserved protein of unknown function [Thiomonas sp. OC7]